jgi:hypothetical protein
VLRERLVEAHDRAMDLIERADGCLAVLAHLRMGIAVMTDDALAGDASGLAEVLHRAGNGSHGPLQRLMAFLKDLMIQCDIARGEIDPLAASAFHMQTVDLAAIAAAELAVQGNEVHVEDVFVKLETVRLWFERFDRQLNGILTSLRKSP